MKPRSHPGGTTGSNDSDTPGRGAVINYAFLFAAEHAAGREEGTKDRPAIIVTADDHGYIVVPVTTRGEMASGNSIAIPPDVGRTMGLPRPHESSVVVTEANSFDWMGHDVRRLPDGRIIYGMTPPGFLAGIIREIIARRVKPVNRR